MDAFRFLIESLGIATLDDASTSSYVVPTQVREYRQFYHKDMISVAELDADGGNGPHSSKHVSYQ